MLNSAARLDSDPVFCERVVALDATVPRDNLRPLDGMIGHMERFAAVRRCEVHAARFDGASGDEAVSWRSQRDALPQGIAALIAAIGELSALARMLRPIVTPALDDIIALAADRDHPLRDVLYELGRTLGFADLEIDWVFKELASIDWRPVHLVCADGFDDLLALLEAVSVGELGLLVAGFVRRTGDPQIDERVEKLIIRLRSVNVTASIFLPLVIVATAHVVATQHLQPRT
ncbi:hypothetical protein [Sorangium sp. So ce693]|uniref:hypothetical protein n=1 Tax=Sorangium sp. So ce693 TaxID=3133318 RepID=UPI003F5E7CD9